MATVGAQSTSGLQLWAQDLNAAGGIKGRQIELDICDDQGTPENAVTCARRHIERRVALILDNSISSTIRAITPLLKDGPVMVVVSQMSSSIWRPLMPPAAFKSCAHNCRPDVLCAPTVAIGPVSGEITPTTNGSAANAETLNAAATNRPQHRPFR